MDSVTVSVPARLHLGFLDLNGGLGRKFGSLGVAISGIATTVTLRRAASSSFKGPDSNRAERYLSALASHLGTGSSFALHVEEAIPAHAGLGSGTQIALAIAAALRTLCRLAPSTRNDAVFLDRGARSGIGIGLFETGGLVLDAGRGGTGGPPPIIARHPFPEDWRIILVLDPRHQGVHGTAETDAFARLSPFPESEAAHLCRLALMQVLPALIEHDLPAFGAAIAEMQRRLGDHFAAAQGGRYASPLVARCAVLLEAAGAHGCGQSSWGPTGFAFAASLEEADRLRAAATSDPALSELEIKIVEGKNTGARIAPNGEK